MVVALEICSWQKAPAATLFHRRMCLQGNDIARMRSATGLPFITSLGKQKHCAASIEVVSIVKLSVVEASFEEFLEEADGEA